MVYCTQDVSVTTIDFEGALPGMTYLFSAPKKHHLIMPEVSILSEEEAAGTSVDRQSKPENIDVANTSILAKEMGMSKKQLMATQKAVLKEAEKSKQVKAAQELEQLKQAVPDQSVNVDSQRFALQAFEKDNNEMKIAKRPSLPPSGEAYAGKGNAQLQPRPPHRQHSYEPMSPSTQRTKMDSLTKSASISQGEHIYDHLNRQGFQPRQQHEQSVQPEPSPRNLCDQQPQKRLCEKPPCEHTLQQPSYKRSYPPLQQLPQQSPEHPAQHPPQQLHKQPSLWSQLPSHQPPQQQQPPPNKQHAETGMPPSGGEVFAFVPSSTQHQVLRSLSKGSTVQLGVFSEAGPAQPRYGVIRWVGEITGVTGTIAGVELV